MGVGVGLRVGIGLRLGFAGLRRTAASTANPNPNPNPNPYPNPNPNPNLNPNPNPNPNPDPNQGALFNPARGGGAASGPVTMDDEYASFMAELGGGGPPKIDSAELAAQVEAKPPRAPLPDCGVHCSAPETPLWPSRADRRRGANPRQRAG